MADILPPELEKLRDRCRAALGKVREADSASKASKEFWLKAGRSDGGRSLPAYFLVYFLLVDLLEFEHDGHGEKVAWSIPIDYEGVLFLVDHRKFGCGVFAEDLPNAEPACRAITEAINKAVKVATPYFEWRAGKAAEASALNVINEHSQLMRRYEYFLASYKAKKTEAEARKKERVETKHKGGGVSFRYPSFQLRNEAQWLSLAALECFFSWTEHVFIHIAILNGKAKTGTQVANLAGDDWSAKFKAALSLDDADTKQFYDDLLVIRRQLRNTLAHGSFGKNGEAFLFHSGAGAVPLLLPHKRDNRSFRFGVGVSIADEAVMEIIEKFVGHIWAGKRRQAKIYIESGLPLILTMAKDGTYADAMRSLKGMKELVEGLHHMFDRAGDMDW